VPGEIVDGDSMPRNSFGIPVCDGRTNLEKLAELLEISTERPALDYKATTDLSKTEDVVEMARDLGAMRSNPRLHRLRRR
jgi:hypothetical protein